MARHGSDYISVTDLFSIGIGPSSSHTVGPMKAALHFARDAADHLDGTAGARVDVELYGSLGATGRGHATDRAVLWGLAGYHPRTCPDAVISDLWDETVQRRSLALAGGSEVVFDPEESIRFLPGTVLEHHVNGVRFVLSDGDGELVCERTYFSVGGGFVTALDDDGGVVPLDVSPEPPRELPAEPDHPDVTASVAAEPDASSDPIAQELREEVNPAVVSVDGPPSVPHPFHSGAELLDACTRAGLGVADLVRANECTFLSSADLDRELDAIWHAMSSCVAQGLKGYGTLPGVLRVPRRAGKMYDALKESHSAVRFEPVGGDAAPGRTVAPGGVSDPLLVIDWVNLYALAVNEENASGHRVVTAPTNGAAGVVPAVLTYYVRHLGGTREGVRKFLLAATAIGAIVKLNASIAGAEVGCQGEVGSASAMAAAGLAEVMGGTPAQVENAAEIAMEHNLGLTCDPIGGLVQIPCIERNAVAAVKSINAARLAMWGDGTHTVSLDAVVETMRQTGMDMMSKYKETSLGGLAVNVVEC